MKTKKRLKDEVEALTALCSQVILEAQGMAEQFAEHDKELHARIEELERRHERPLDDNRGQYL